MQAGRWDVSREEGHIEALGSHLQVCRQAGGRAAGTQTRTGPGTERPAAVQWIGREDAVKAGPNSRRLEQRGTLAHLRLKGCRAGHANGRLAEQLTLVVGEDDGDGAVELPIL